MAAAHMAHGRQLWTTCRKRCTSELCSSRHWTVDPSTPETRGQTCWSCPLPVALQPRRGVIRASTTRRARSTLSQLAVTLPASRFASHSLAPHAASARPGTASVPSSVPPTRSYLCPRADARESNPCEKRRGFLVLPSASCSATPQSSRPKPQQTDIATPACSPLASRVLCI